MDVLQAYDTRLLNRFIETAQMHDWAQLEHVLIWLQDNFAVFLLCFCWFWRLG